jgi:hypothetical protein
MTTRTDPHAKGSIVPAEYNHVISYSLSAGTAPSLGVNCVIDNRRREYDEAGRIVSETPGEHGTGHCCLVQLRAAGVRWAEHGDTGRCTACGAAFMHGEVWRHLPTGEHIHVGHICGEKYGLLVDRSAHELEMDRRRQAAAVMIERARKAEARRTFLAAHPGLEEALKTDHGIVGDIGRRFIQNAELSEKQVALVFKLAAEAATPKPDAEKLVPAPVASGRQTVEGEVVSVKVHESAYGDSVKMTVKVQTPEGVWLAWGTRPSNLQCTRGSKVRFEASLKAGRDAHFALFSRPTKAVLVAAAQPVTP